MERPTGTIETILGNVEYAASKDFVYLRAANMTINSVLYSSVQCRTKFKDGQWVVESYHEPSLSRPDWKDPSFAARAKVEKVFITAWIKHLSKHPKLMLQAKAYHASGELERCQNKLDEARKVVEQLEAERERLIEVLSLAVYDALV